MGFPRGYLGAFETGPVTNDELVNLPGRFRLRGEIGGIGQIDRAGLAPLDGRPTAIGRSENEPTAAGQESGA